MVNWRDGNGIPIKGGIRIVLPPHVWERVRELRYEQSIKPVYQSVYKTHPSIPWAVQASKVKLEYYNPPISETAWFRNFIRAHHNDPIAYPAPIRYLENGEADRTARRDLPLHCSGDPMTGKPVRFGPHAYRLLAARAELEEKPMSEVLRRLIRQTLAI